MAAMHLPPAHRLAVLPWAALPWAVMLAVAGAARAEEPWPVAGQQGVVRNVIVPEAQARDREAYRRQILLLCGEGDRTCFLNFFTNSTGAPLAVPLPEAIASEPAAMYRRSNKQQGEFFRFSCRLQLDPQGCF